MASDGSPEQVLDEKHKLSKGRVISSESLITACTCPNVAEGAVATIRLPQHIDYPA